MDGTLAAFGSLFLSVALAVAGASPSPVAPLPSPTPEPQQPPPERVLVVVLDADALTERFTLEILATRLHVTDPSATPVVMTPADPTRMVGSFAIDMETTASGDALVEIRTSHDGGSAVSVSVPATAANPAGPSQGTVVEVLGGTTGIVAHREGLLDLTPDEVRVPAWQLPGRGADAVALEGAWWTLGPTRNAAEPLASPVTDRVRSRLARDPVSRMRRLVDVSVGDVTGDGTPDVALSFRRPFRQTLLNASSPRRSWTDAGGLSAHVGLYRIDDLSEIWVAGTLVRPVRRLAACTGALAVAYSTLRRDRITATSAWRWQGFAFVPLPDLPGSGTPTCIDIDRDGRPEAAIIERS